jgi:hypothetical protein
MKTSLQRIRRTVLGFIALFAAFSSGVAAERSEGVQTALGSTTVSSYVETHIVWHSSYDGMRLPPPVPGPVSPMLPPLIHSEPFLYRIEPATLGASGPDGTVTPFATPVPEPSTMALLVGGAVGLFFAARRRARKP